MNDKSLIDTIKDVLQNYSGIDLEQPKTNNLLIYIDSEDGINISLLASDIEYKLNFNEYSKHFDRSEEAQEEITDLIIAAILGRARLQEFSKNGYPYKWKLQCKTTMKIGMNIALLLFLI